MLNDAEILAFMAALLVVKLSPAATFTQRAASAWTPPDSAAPYLDAMRRAERAHGLPDGMLARVAYQESRYRQDIITGQVKSAAGAVGLMQIVPRWHPGVDPLDPFASIDYAARYLAALKKQFGTWAMALAAYNWGPGNLRKYTQGAAMMPGETINYVAEISADVPGVYA